MYSTSSYLTMTDRFQNKLLLNNERPSLNMWLTDVNRFIVDISSRFAINTSLRVMFSHLSISLLVSKQDYTKTTGPQNLEEGIIDQGRTVVLYSRLNYGCY